MTDADEPEPRTRAQAAFERAVGRERSAIHLHTVAAEAEEATAESIEEQAAQEGDDIRREELLRRAAADRERADRARERAQHARDRLISEGEDPES